MAPLRLSEGDFVLLPPNPGFGFYSDDDVQLTPTHPSNGGRVEELRHGDQDGEPTFKMLGGHFEYDPANADLLTGLLPAIVHIKRAALRLAQTIELIADEALNDRPGRDLIVDRLVEVLLIEALRFRPDDVDALARTGLLEGLADTYLARALRSVHADVARHWTVAELAREAGLSRSAFSERFTRKVGMAPMEYLISWRMALAKDLLRREDPPLEKVAAAIGYESASAFSTAFRRQVGKPPGEFARSAA
jgi:AraC-like DNA-binding protein